MGQIEFHDWRDSAMRQPALEASRWFRGCWKYEQIHIISKPRGLNASATSVRRPRTRLGRLTVQCALSRKTRSVSEAEKQNWRPDAMARAGIANASPGSCAVESLRSNIYVKQALIPFVHARVYCRAPCRPLIGRSRPRGRLHQRRRAEPLAQTASRAALSRPLNPGRCFTRCFPRPRPAPRRRLYWSAFYSRIKRVPFPEIHRTLATWRNGLVLGEAATPRVKKE